MGNDIQAGGQLSRWIALEGESALKQGRAGETLVLSPERCAKGPG